VLLGLLHACHYRQRPKNKRYPALLRIALNNELKTNDEAIITVRGKPRYVVMTMAHYDHLRDCELEAALHEVKAMLHRFNTMVLYSRK
jgi:hypothetical protein